MQGLGEAIILAPDHNWSAAGHSKTMHKPLRIHRVRLPDGSLAYTTDGAPSDCVSIAALGFLGWKPDLVVSGINKGSNMGDDVTYSGTVAGAMEGLISGIPALAVSLDGYRPDDPEGNYWDVAARIAAHITEQILQRGWPADTLFNINIPNLPADQIRGLEITRLGWRGYRDELVERVDPFGRPYYWIGAGPATHHNEPGTDIWALAAGKVSITPIHLDLTNHALIRAMGEWHLSLPQSEGRGL